jgi:hypothetical protein
MLSKFCTECGKRREDITAAHCAWCHTAFGDVVARNDDQRAKIQESVRRRSIHEFYHFTSALQVLLIVRHAAIHPRALLRTQKLPFLDHSQQWGNPAKAEELSHFVSTAIAPPRGMMRNESYPIILSLKPDLLWSGRAAFVGIWASDGRIKGSVDVLSTMSAEHFDSMFAGPGKRLRRDLPREQLIPGEVLIRGSISLSDVKRIYCPTAYSRTILGELLKGEFSKAGHTIDVLDRPELFGRSEAA